MRRVARGLAALAFVAGHLLFPASAAPAAVTMTTDVQYGQAGGERLLLDVYEPAGGGLRPGVVAVHGGRWSNGDKADIPGEDFAERGHVVFAVDYRLAPDHPYPAALEDIRTAVRWVKVHAGEYGVDPDRVWAMGGSAGGHLVGLLATTSSGEAGVRAAVSYSGPMDLVRLAQSSPTIQKAVREFLGCSDWDKACRKIAEEASPISQVDRSDAPMYLANGSDESIPLPQATSMAERLDAEGVEHRLRVVQGSDHAFQYLRDVLVPSTSFASQQLGGPPPEAEGGSGTTDGDEAQGEPGDGGGTGEGEGEPDRAPDEEPDETRRRATPAVAQSPAAEDRGGGWGWVPAVIIGAVVLGAVVVAVVFFREPRDGPPA